VTPAAPGVGTKKPIRVTILSTDSTSSRRASAPNACSSAQNSMKLASQATRLEPCSADQVVNGMSLKATALTKYSRATRVRRSEKRCNGLSRESHSSAV